MTYADMWLLDVTSMTWKKVRYYHTLFMCIIYDDVITIIISHLGIKGRY